MSTQNLNQNKKEERLAVREVLILLAGKSVTSMTKAEQEQFISALGQLMGVIDENGLVKQPSA